MNRTFKLKYRIKSKFRFIVFLVLILMLAYMLVTGLFGIYTANGDSIDQYKQVSIQSGDTLWSISQKHAPKNMDIRRYVSKVSKLNNLDDETLSAGQQIIVPIY